MKNSYNEQPKKKLLYEVSIIRPMVIFLLVVLHSFTKIGEGGGNFQDYQLAGAYQWFVWLISGFRIETIALVAGYVFSYQSHDLGRSYKFWPFVWKKFKRLIIPMVVFGVIYYFCFFFNADTFTTKEFLLKVFSGCGHLWFLPMLFWCFIAIWIIDHYKWDSWILLVLLAIVSIVPSPKLPLGFSRLPHFIFYVYGGYYLWTKRDSLFKHCLTWKCIIFLWITYIVLVIFSHTVLVFDFSQMVSYQKLVALLITNFVRLLIAFVGIVALYLTVCKFTTKKEFSPKRWVVSASDNCYGVYVYHQFILVWLYFYTPLVSLLPPLVVPWVGLAITLPVSLFATRLTLKTKTGRFLIG